MASTMSSSAAFVVTIRMGTFCVAAFARSARMNSMPLISGMFQSVITMSTVVSASRASPSTPFPASRQSLWPSFVSVLMMMRRIVLESSTTRNRMGICGSSAVQAS
jgi:hypothetical protein